jgi:tetratricopeptide (TPR) repeat protein
MAKQTLASQSDNHKAQYSHEMYSQGMMLANFGCYAEALASVDLALETQPDNPKAWVLRGGILTHLNRYKEALTCFEEALKIQPDDKDACLFRGVALHHLGRYKQAYASYDTVLGIEQPSVGHGLIQRIKDFWKFNRLSTTVADCKETNSPDHNLASLQPKV